MNDRSENAAYCIGRIAVLLVTFAGLEAWIVKLAQLPEVNYFEPSIAWQLVRNSWGWPLLVAAPIAGVLVARGGLAFRWDELQRGIPLRWFITFVAAIVAWTYATYEYNYWFDQSHLTDRAALVVLTLLVCWRPLFVLPFALLSVAIIWQFNYPIGGFSVLEQYRLVRLLILFFAGFLWCLVSKRRDTVDIVFLACCLVASNYWWPGVGKLRLDWISYGNLHHLVYAAYNSGWLANLDAATISRFGSLLARLDWPMRIATLSLECGALFALWKRPAICVFLIGWTGFHLAVFMIAGFLFWKWILVNAALLILVFRASPELFDRKRFLCSLIIVGGSIIWFKPGNLSWYDSPLSYSFRFDAISEVGRRYPLPAHYFAPYGYQFTLGDFLYLVDEPRLYIVYGASFSRAEVAALQRVKAPGDWLAAERAVGRVHYNEAKARRLETFLQATFRGRNRGRTSLESLRWVRPPRQLWTIARSAELPVGEKIIAIEIHEVTAVCENKDYREIRQHLVWRAEISQ